MESSEPPVQSDTRRCKYCQNSKYPTLIGGSTGWLDKDLQHGYQYEPDGTKAYHCYSAYVEA